MRRHDWLRVGTLQRFVQRLFAGPTIGKGSPAGARAAAPECLAPARPMAEVVAGLLPTPEFPRHCRLSSSSPERGYPCSVCSRRAHSPSQSCASSPPLKPLSALRVRRPARCHSLPLRLPTSIAWLAAAVAQNPSLLKQ
jgi:hypothetical protein